jgi:NAD dependent epimerase/dehydratase family
MGVTKVVFASSAAGYGDVTEMPVGEDALCRPVSPYGIHKLASEHALAYYSDVYSVNTAALRFFNVYGPRQDPTSPYSGVISIFTDRARAGTPLTIFGDGGQTRDFVYVGDVVRGSAVSSRTSAPAARSACSSSRDRSSSSAASARRSSTPKRAVARSCTRARASIGCATCWAWSRKPSSSTACARRSADHWLRPFFVSGFMGSGTGARSGSRCSISPRKPSVAVRRCTGRPPSELGSSA